MSPKINSSLVAQSLAMNTLAMNTLADSLETKGKEATNVLYGDMQKKGSCSNRLLMTQNGQSASKAHVDNILSKLL